MTNHPPVSLRSQGLLLMLFIILLLQACHQQDSREELQQWLNTVSLTQATLALSAPELPVLVAPSYTALTLDAPFNRTADIDSSMLDTQLPAALIKSHHRHTAQILEEFSLDSIEMLGSITKGQERYALLKAGGHLYTAKPGDYLGKNCGSIRSISEDLIVIEEQTKSEERSSKHTRKDSPRIITISSTATSISTTSKGIAK